MRKQEVEKLLEEMSSNGRAPSKLEFIKELRARHRLGLTEATQACETVFSVREMPRALTESDLEPILSRVYSEESASGNTNLISMIKRVREQTGLGLKESKDLVEAYVRKRNPELVSSRSGCLGAIVGIRF